MIAAVALVALSLAAPAHQVGLSRGLYTSTNDSVDLELILARGEAARTVKNLDLDGNGVLDDREVNAAAAYFATDVVDQIVIARAGKRCDGKFVGASLTEEDGLAIRAHYDCAVDASAAPTDVDFALAKRLSTGHRHLAHLVTASGESDAVAFASSTTFAIPSASGAAPKESASRLAFFKLGVEHILTGFDHLVFLFGLILIGGRLRSLLAVITAFTVAHSITLGLAVMGVFAPPPAVIEPLIAASIAYVGVENFFVKNAEGRWRITAPFGLVHGFGFAGALAEVGVPKTEVPLTLFLFNFGVECGQLMVLAVVLPILWLARKRGWLDARAVKGLSVVVILLGTFWLVQRVLTALGVV
jgi:hypothetical protein